MILAALRWFAILMLVPSLCAASEKDVRDLMVTNTTTFLVADKQDGSLYLVDPSAPSIIKTSALYGKNIGDQLPAGSLDTIGDRPQITPSGEFTVTRMYSTKLQQYILVFMEGKQVVMAIHKLYTGNKSQQREVRIQSDNPAEKRITNGCINVLPEFWDDHLNKLPDGIKLYILSDK